MKRWKTVLTAAIVVSVVAVFLYRAMRPSEAVVSDAAPTVLASPDGDAPEATLEDVLDLAAQARQAMIENVDDYTAKFIKQETDSSGALSAETVMLVKIQTRHQGGELGTPMRVYLKWLAPEDLVGREAIWAEDLHDGKLLVHETGLMGMFPIPPLDPNGLLAMRGQKYPISNIGQTRLVEQLIERGQQDLGNPDVSVAIVPNSKLGDVPATLIQITRAKPTDDPDDFSLAEIHIDAERQLILRYRSFGWPDADGGTPGLLESYAYEDIQLNVGLTDQDFDPNNDEYAYP